MRIRLSCHRMRKNTVGSPRGRIHHRSIDHTGRYIQFRISYKNPVIRLVNRLSPTEQRNVIKDKTTIPKSFEIIGKDRPQLDQVVSLIPETRNGMSRSQVYLFCS